jgi:hypothetical protein
MNCLDFRRCALVNPLQLDEAAREHALACDGCREFLERQRELDAKLYDAIRIPVPDGLADRVLVAQGLRHRGRRWLWGLAATVVLAAGLAGFLPWLSGNALGREAIAHVKEEPQSFRLVTKHASGLLPAALADQGVKLVVALGEVTYSQLCPMKDQKARHLVVATAGGPATLLLMPDDRGWRRRSVVEADGMTAITIPVARGSIAIVAASRSQALAIEQSLRFS